MSFEGKNLEGGAVLASRLAEEGRELGQRQGLRGWVVAKLGLDHRGLKASTFSINAELDRGPDGRFGSLSNKDNRGSCGGNKTAWTHLESQKSRLELGENASSGAFLGMAGAGLPGLKPSLHCSLVVWPWTGCLTSLTPPFPLLALHSWNRAWRWNRTSSIKRLSPDKSHSEPLDQGRSVWSHPREKGEVKENLCLPLTAGAKAFQPTSPATLLAVACTFRLFNFFLLKVKLRSPGLAVMLMKLRGGRDYVAAWKINIEVSASGFIYLQRYLLFAWVIIQHQRIILLISPLKPRPLQAIQGPLLLVKS